MVKTKIEINDILRDSLHFLKKKISVGSAYLFGSYATGDATPLSDLDLAIFSPDADKMRIEEKAKLAAALKLQCHSDVELHFFSMKALNEARPTNFCGYILKTGKKVI